MIRPISRPQNAWRLAIVFSMMLAPFQFAVAQDELDQAVTEIAQKISQSVRDNDRRTIAVVDFANIDGSMSALGQHIAESLITEFFLVAPDRLEVIERRHLALVLREQKLTMNQLFDPKSLASVGQLLGVEEIATGTITDLDDQVEINTRLISVNTGRVTSAFRIRIRKLGTVNVLLDRQAAEQPLAAAHPTQKNNRNGSTPKQRVVIDGVIIEIDRAKRTGSSVTVDFSFTSSKRDVDFLLGAKSNPGSSMISDQGMSHRANQSIIGSAKSSNYAIATMVTGIRTKGSCTFDGVESDATTISRLDLRGKRRLTGEANWADNWSAIVRNIPIE